MVYGLRLAGTAADAADLEMLVAALPELVDAPWSVIAAPEGGGVVIFSEAIDRGSARKLRQQGVGVVRVEEAEAEGVVRRAETLLEAIPPLRLDGDPIAAEALFLSASPRALLERLLLLGRDDAQIMDLTSAFSVRLTAPPLYLLMRARDQPEEETTAFALVAPHLWIEWGYTHPLAAVAARALERTDRSALIGADGRWRFLPRQFPMRSIYEAIEPKLEAPRLDLTPSPTTARFVIPLRFGPGEEHEPELWLVDADRFFELEHFVQDASEEEIRRLTVARLTSRPGRNSAPLYLLRERPKPGATRLGTRLSDLLGSRGFTKAAGTENLFLPVGRRLLPKVGREELRRLLDLGSAALVIVDEDRDGPKILRATDLGESPLSDWLDYVATDRRVELDRLLERTVFAFPPMEVERPAASMKAPPAMPPPKPEPRVIGSKKSRPANDPIAEQKPALDRASLDDLAEIREQARALEAKIAEGGCDDPRLWRELAELLMRLGEIDESAACLESAMFFSRTDPQSLAQLVELRGQTYDGRELDLVDLVVKEAHAPREASYLGARFVEAIARGDRLMDDMVQVALQTFLDPGLPVSRRLAWVVLSSWHASVDDKLGLTRAREALLGAINDRGLSELYDLPRFVRYALALEDDERGTNTERARVEQLEALERLLSRAYGASYEGLTELDVLGNYVRVLFATGMMRLGAGSHARALVRSVENELPAHDAPNQLLFRLYLARMAFEATESERAAWQTEVDQILSASEDRGRRPAAWLTKRSIWLGHPDDKPEPSLRSLIDRLLATAQDEQKELGATLTKLATDRVYKLYDWELTVVIERLIKTALASGSDELIDEVLEAAQAQLPAIAILGHRVKAIAACLKAAATLDQPQRIEALVDRIIEVSASKEVPWVRELLFAVKPCLLILRRLGAKEPASRLLESLEPLPVRTKLESSLLTSALADGYLQLDRRERADELLDRSLAIVFDPDLDYVARYESGAMAIDVLRHWPTVERANHFHRFISQLDHFKDLYTTSEWFEAHKVLLLERIVDAMADSATRQSDRVQAFLDLEEHAVRAKIISDWKRTCGR